MSRKTSRQLEYSLWCSTESAPRNIWLSDNPVVVLKKHLSMLVGHFVATKVTRVCNKDKP